MFVECDDRRLLPVSSFVSSLQHGLDAGLRGADGGHQPDKAEDRVDPQAKAEFALEPVSKPQEEAQRKQKGNTELGDPKQEIEYLHAASGKNGQNKSMIYKTLYRNFSDNSMCIYH